MPALDFKGKVDCIYIDPPYNTGTEGWCYNDAVNAPLMREWLKKAANPVERDSLQRHDKWLCMMWPRLQLLKELLSTSTASTAPASFETPSPFSAITKAIAPRRHGFVSRRAMAIGVAPRFIETFESRAKAHFLRRGESECGVAKLQPDRPGPACTRSAIGASGCPPALASSITTGGGTVLSASRSGCT